MYTRHSLSLITVESNQNQMAQHFREPSPFLDSARAPQKIEPPLLTGGSGVRGCARAQTQSQRADRPSPLVPADAHANAPVTTLPRRRMCCSSTSSRPGSPLGASDGGQIARPGPEQSSGVLSLVSGHGRHARTLQISRRIVSGTPTPTAKPSQGKQA